MEARCRHLFITSLVFVCSVAAVREQVEELLQVEVCMIHIYYLLFKYNYWCINYEGHPLLIFCYYRYKCVVFVFFAICVSLQDEWDSFLDGVDKGLQTTDRQLAGPGAQIADSLSPETPLTDGRSGKWVHNPTLSVCESAWRRSVYDRSFCVVCFEGAWLWVSTWIGVRSCCWFSSDILDDYRDETTWPSWRPIRSDLLPCHLIALRIKRVCISLLDITWSQRVPNSMIKIHHQLTCRSPSHAETVQSSF